jgi:adenylate cyclase
MKMRQPLTSFLLGAALLGLAVVVRMIDPEPVARLRLSIFDTYQRFLPRMADPAHRVTIVNIDTESLDRVGQWPWPRTRLAQIIENLRQVGARVIALDLILAEPDRLSPSNFASLLNDKPEAARLAEELAKLPSNDDRLAAAIETAPVVLGFVAEGGSRMAIASPKARLAFAGDNPELFVPTFSSGTGSLPVLMQRASGMGSVNWLPSSDQIVRRVPLLVSVGGALYPSFALEVARVGTQQSTIFVRSSGGSGVLAFGQRTGVESIRFGPIEVPSDSNGEMWLHFSYHESVRDISAHRILEGKFERGEVEGRFVLIGVSAPGLLDLRATPLQSAVPGVAIHAQALEQILSGKHLNRPAFATGMEILFLVAVGVSVALLMQGTGPTVAALIGVAAILLVSMLSWLAYSRYGLLFDPIYPTLSLIALYVTSSLSSYIKSEMERSFVRSAFSHYLAAPLVEQLANDHKRLKLGGEMREVTVLFADVRGFSKISEGLDAEALIVLVNQIFTPLSEVILTERGTIDKFMGDAVMAFWNAPVSDASHARNASLAALSMIHALDELNRARAAEAKARGEAAAPIRIGIGLNTGECCVGNMGSPQRFDYSILGDSVNVASRLQDATKMYGLPIIAGERTAAGAPALAFVEIDTVMLRGKTRPERIFALLGEETMAGSVRFRELQASIRELNGAIKSNDRATAQAKLEECRALDWTGLESLLEMYRARLE